MKRLARLGAWALAAGLFITAAAPALAGGRPRNEPPKRVLIVVIDQMRTDFPDVFEMPNFEALQDDGVNFVNAYLGHMGAETVITHNVITSGLLPKNMGWSDEVHRDVANVLGHGPGAFHVTSSFSREEFFALQSAGGYVELTDYLHREFPGTKFAAIGEKTTAVYGFASPRSDIVVTLSGRRTTAQAPCFMTLGGSWREPAGVNVPTYLATPGTCGRFYINSDPTNDYGTLTTSPAWMYPEDGNRFVPGFDPAHLGGDTWVADAAMAIMEREPWSGIAVSFGGTDKVAHMWGGITDTAIYPPGSVQEMVHEQFNAKNTDAQLGRLVDKLRALGQLDETLIVVTTDHGGAPSLNFHGINALNRSNFNWYYGRDADETYLMPQPQLAPLIATGNVGFSYQDSAIRTWLVDQSLAKKREAARVMRTLPNVIATYFRVGDHYRLDSTDTSTEMTRSERKWWRKHGKELVDTMAAPWSADVVGLLSDNTSYGVAGDHGGAQENVQRIPMVFWAEDVKARERARRFRSVDILPTVLKAMDIRRTSRMDGKARNLPGL